MLLLTNHQIKWSKPKTYHWSVDTKNIDLNVSLTKKERKKKKYRTEVNNMFLAMVDIKNAD